MIFSRAFFERNSDKTRFQTIEMAEWRLTIDVTKMENSLTFFFTLKENEGERTRVRHSKWRAEERVRRAEEPEGSLCEVPLCGHLANIGFRRKLVDIFNLERCRSWNPKWKKRRGTSQEIPKKELCKRWKCEQKTWRNYLRRTSFLPEHIMNTPTLWMRRGNRSNKRPARRSGATENLKNHGQRQRQGSGVGECQNKNKLAFVAKNILFYPQFFWVHLQSPAPEKRKKEKEKKKF